MLLFPTRKSFPARFRPVGIEHKFPAWKNIFPTREFVNDCSKEQKAAESPPPPTPGLPQAGL